MTKDSNLSGEHDVPERYNTALMTVDWEFEAERLRDMSIEERFSYDIELAEKIRRLGRTFEEIGVILAAAGITYEGESPRTLIDRTMNPDKYISE